MPMNSKFLTESTGEKIVKIGKYLAKIWPKYDSLVFLGHSVYCWMVRSFVRWSVTKFVVISRKPQERFS